MDLKKIIFSLSHKAIKKNYAIYDKNVFTVWSLTAFVHFPMEKERPGHSSKCLFFIFRI